MMTCPTGKAAEKIRDHLLAENLAACVLTLDVDLHCLAKDGIDGGKKKLLIIQTKAILYKEVERHILKIHPEKKPDIIQQPITGGYHPYLNWLHSSVRTH